MTKKDDSVKVEVNMKHIPHAKANSAKIKLQKKKKKIVVISSTKIVNASFMRPKIHRQSAAITLKDKQ